MGTNWRWTIPLTITDKTVYDNNKKIKILKPPDSTQSQFSSSKAYICYITYISGYICKVYGARQ